MFYERLSTTEEFNLKGQHPHNLEHARYDLEDRYGKSVTDDWFDNDDSYSSGDGLSVQPLVDAAKLVIWAYSTPKRAIATSTAVFFAGIHFGWFSLPLVIFKILEWTGIGLVATSSCLLAKEMVIKINGKEISKAKGE